MRYLVTMVDGSRWLTDFECDGAILRPDGREVPTRGTVLARAAGSGYTQRVHLNLSHVVTIEDTNP